MTALYAALAALVALVAAYVGGRVQGASSQRDKDQSGKVTAYEKHLEDIADAGSARNRVQPGDSVSDDKYRRD